MEQLTVHLQNALNGKKYTVVLNAEGTTDDLFTTSTKLGYDANKFELRLQDGKEVDRVPVRDSNLTDGCLVLVVPGPAALAAEELRKRRQNNVRALWKAVRDGDAPALRLHVAVGRSTEKCEESGRTPLHEAAGRGHVECVQCLLESGHVDANCQDKHGWTPLALAVKNGHNRTLLLLLQHGADPNLGNERDETPRYGHLEACETLVVNGAAVNKFSTRQQTALYCAIRHGHHAVRDFLRAKGAVVSLSYTLYLGRPVDEVLQALQDGADPNLSAIVHRNSMTPLEAADVSDLQVLRTLLEWGARPTNKTHILFLYSHRQPKYPEKVVAGVQMLIGVGCRPPPMGVAARFGNADLVSYLLSEGVPLDHDVLHYAGSAAVAELLIAKGADVDAMRYDHPPLCSVSDAGVVQVLLAAGANPQIPITPMVFHPEAVPNLVAAGFDVNELGSEGFAALHLTRSRPLVEALVACGADLRVVDKEGNTPLRRAACTGAGEVIGALVHAGVEVGAEDLFASLDSAGVYTPPYTDCTSVSALRGFAACGADLNCKNQGGETLLHVSVANQRYSRASQTLLELGADVRQVDAQHRTPAHCAVTADMLQALLDAGADPCCTDANSKTPLHVHAARGDADCVCVLLAAGIDLEQRDADGWTALHHAAASGGHEAVQVLLGGGACLSSRNNNGQTAEDVAVLSGNTFLLPLMQALDHSTFRSILEEKLSDLEHNK